MTTMDALFRITPQGGADVVEFMRKDLLDEADIRQAGDEIYNHLKQRDDLRLVVDFHRVEHLSSAALGMVVALDKVVRMRKGQLRLAGINEEIYKVFKITKLHKLVKICDDTPTALESFK